jgi:hypothetical protein
VDMVDFVAERASWPTITSHGQQCWRSAYGGFSLGHERPCAATTERTLFNQ